MQENYLYHYKKSRKQRSILFIRMAVVFLIYIAALYLVELYTTIEIPKDTRNVMVIAFSIAAIILFYVAWWHIKNPATYEAYITNAIFSVSYPKSDMWSFKVNVYDIERIEHRQTHSSGGKSILKTGVVMKNGDYHVISMNYGNSINKMYKVLKSINPEIVFPMRVKTSYFLFGKKIR